MPILPVHIDPEAAQMVQTPTEPEERGQQTLTPSSGSASKSSSSTTPRWVDISHTGVLLGLRRPGEANNAAAFPDSLTRSELLMKKKER